MLKKIKSKTFGLFIINLIIIVLVLIFASFWESLKISENKIPLAIAVTVTFGLSVAGFILGLTEIKNDKKTKQWIGFLGNILVILFFILMVYLGASG